MKMKSLLCLSIASIVSTHALALQITNGHLLSHKEWTTGNVKGKFVLSHKQKTALQQSDEEMSSIADSEGANGLVNMPVTSDGYHFIGANNDSQEARTYTYIYSDCVVLNDKEEQCMFSFNRVVLEPQGAFTDAMDGQLEVSLPSTGSYRTYTTTKIYAEGRPGSTESQSYGIIMVS